MQCPVTIENLMAEWMNDAKVDESEPGRALLEIPKLHSKYMNVMSHHNLRSKKLQTEYATRKRIKWEYYSGELNNPDDLRTHNLEPLMKKILRSDISTYLDSDSELISILLKKAVQDEIVEFCKAIIKELNSRTYQLRSFIEWEKFVSGSG